MIQVKKKYHIAFFLEADICSVHHHMLHNIYKNVPSDPTLAQLVSLFHLRIYFF
jgi:hypothetical protein